MAGHTTPQRLGFPGGAGGAFDQPGVATQPSGNVQSFEDEQGNEIFVFGDSTNRYAGSSTS